MVVHICNPSYGRKRKVGGLGPVILSKKLRPYLQNNQNKRSGDMASAEEHLPSKQEVLNSNPIITHTHTHFHTF
jgi:hypothetical protein